MTIININNQFSHKTNIKGISKVSYFGVDKKVHSATSIEQIYAVFTSNILVAPAEFLKWKSIELDCINKKNIWVYVRTSNDDIGSSEWEGPFKNNENQLAISNNKFIQIMIVMKCDNATTPEVKSVGLEFISSQSSKYFFTKSFDLSFKPKHVLVSYNAEKSDDAILRFAVTGEETTDLSKYQFVEPNKIQELYDIPLFSNKIKLMMELAGDSGIPISVNEIGIMFSGDQIANINSEILEQEESSEENDESIDSDSSSSSSSSSSNYEGIGFDRIAIDFLVS